MKYVMASDNSWICSLVKKIDQLFNQINPRNVLSVDILMTYHVR